jgi:hypothetical protein
LDYWKLKLTGREGNRCIVYQIKRSDQPSDTDELEKKLPLDKKVEIRLSESKPSLRVPGTLETNDDKGASLLA